MVHSTREILILDYNIFGVLLGYSFHETNTGEVYPSPTPCLSNSLNGF